MKKRIILVSHGKAAEGMMHSVQMIIGQQPCLSSMGMMPGEHYQPMVDEIEREIRENPTVQYIIIADLLGGSVCNGMMTLLQYSNVNLIAGLNMALVISLVLDEEQLSKEEIRNYIEEAKDITKLVQFEETKENEEEEEFF
ncbi:MAG: PTS sugar transporter subunit IIA [bacterium]|nr:PTS sugar transporter subunit IIA [bacterium]